MSIHRSYFSRNNTIVYGSSANTGRNPVVELFFGNVDDLVAPKGYSRFIFDLDLTTLLDKVSNGEISTGCSPTIKHTLRMTNTSSFDKELLNGKWSNGRRRATSFDLFLYRIPLQPITDIPIVWDEGVGYDYLDNINISSPNGNYAKLEVDTDKNFSRRPSNWFESSTNIDWPVSGTYDNTNTTSVLGFKYDELTIVDTQHFEFGNEDIEFDMTNEINSIIDGTITDRSGWGIAFLPSVENITGLTENYSVGFFSRHTQTFYEPFLETNYEDQIEDDRNAFYENKTNKLYLYSYVNGNPISFDQNPKVTLLDSQFLEIPNFVGLDTCEKQKGVYEVVISGLTANTSPCIIYDNWTDIYIDGNKIDDIENQFVVYPLSDYYNIGTTTEQPKLYGFDFAGIKQNEKILNTDVRKVNVIIKKAYTVNEVFNGVESYYRIYVKEGNTEVQVEDWTKLSRTSDGYYFIFDTRDKIPNEYFIDMKVVTNRDVNTYKRELNFEIVDKK